MSSRGDFYIGYQKQAPTALGRFLRRTVLVLTILAVGVGSALALLQNRFDPGVFEFGVVRDFEGAIRESPHPVLLVDPSVTVGDEDVSRFLLVALGKHGAEGEVEGLDTRRVRLQGSLIYRQGEAMIEVVSGSVEPVEPGESTPHAATTDLGAQILSGEIVDAKCFLGVMKPGRGKPHRACATRCISGGIPPVFRVETAEGEFRHFLLTDENGDPVNDQVLDLVAEPIQITGHVSRRGDLYLLAADPATYRRL